MKKSATILLFCLVSLNAIGQSSDFDASTSLEQASGDETQNKGMKDFKGDGYYWYKKIPEKPMIKPKEEKKTAEASPDKPKSMSTEWLRENMPKLRDLAIDNPTKENVANYMYAQRVVLDKAQNFAQAVKEVVATDPFLDENNRIPFGNYAISMQMREFDKGRDEVFKSLAAKGGIWVFTDTPDKCAGCETYINNVITGIPGVPGLATKYNFEFRKIYVRSKEGKVAAKALKLKGTPTTVFVIPPSGYFVVSQGMMAGSALSERMLVAAKSYGVIDADLIEKANPYSKGILTTKEIAAAPSNESPTDVMAGFRKRLNGQ